MNKLYLTCLLVTVLFSRNAASAADLVKFPTGPAVWTIDAVPSPSNSNAPAPNQGHVLRIEVAQDDQKRRTRVSYSTGRQFERWGLPNDHLILAEEPNGNVVAVHDSGDTGSAYSIPFAAACFEWLKPQFRVEKDPISYHGHDCFHYQGTVPVASATGDVNTTGTVKAEAWIDSKTLQPVALDNGTDLGTFTFATTPPPPLVPSGQFAKVFARLHP